MASADIVVCTSQRICYTMLALGSSELALLVYPLFRTCLIE